MQKKNNLLIDFPEHSSLPRTGERYIPGESRITGIESVHRYLLAAELVRGKKVLDVACGEGYGSFLLAQRAAEVVGIDLNAQAVEAARRKYLRDNLSYLCADALRTPFPDHFFEIIVSFETIEHLPSPEDFIKELRRLTVPGGLLILSSPNKTPFDAYSKEKNVFHIQELEEQELETLLSRQFRQVKIHGQNTFFNSMIEGGDQPEFFVRNPEKNLIRQEKMIAPRYSFALASDGEIPALPFSCLLDAFSDPEKGYYEDDEAVVNQFGLRGELVRLQQEKQHLEEEYRQTSGKAEYLYSELLNVREKNLQEKKAQLDLLFEEKRIFLKQIESLENLIQEKKNHSKALAEEKDDLKKEILRSEQEKDDLKKEILRSEQEKDGLKKEILRSEQEKDDLKKEILQSEQEKDGLKKEILRSEQEKDGLKKEIFRLDDKNSNLEQEKNRRISELDQEAAALKHENMELGQHAAQMEHHFTVLHDDVVKLLNSRTFRIAHCVSERIKRMIQTGMKLLCPCLRCGSRFLSCSRREQLKAVAYERFALFFKNTKNYREYQRHRELRCHLLPDLDVDSGPELPPDLPLTSIVIPVYNQVELTRKCLCSIFACRTRAPFEVLIADDCSKENLASLKRDFPSIRIIRNKKNQGFLRTANHAAGEARGEYLLFLNNDTEVLPGWLDELAVALYNHPEAGMIGSQLIHLRTGKLQESGNLICGNGEIMPIGRGEDPLHPEFTYFREVDFCSAASIIVSMKHFRFAGGFDEIYAPAYFEDPDLALKFKRNGWKNYVMPLSKVLHHEMASYGNRLDSGCEKNRRIFLDRWTSFLQKTALYHSRDEKIRQYKFPKKRILYIDAEIPKADRGSGGMDAVFFLEYMLKRGYDVVFHGEYTPGYVPKYTANLLRMGVENVYAPQRHIWEYIRENGYSFDFIFMSRVYQAQCFDRLIRSYAPQATYIFNTVDVHFIRERREAELASSDEKKIRAMATEQLELALMDSADATIVISSDEKNMLETTYGLKRIHHIPQARKVFGSGKEFKDRRGMVFIGSAHPPNMDALLYYVTEILPLLKKQNTDGTLTVIGEALHQEMRKFPEYEPVLLSPDIKFVGFVKDLGEILNGAKLTIAPLRYGAGTKGKVASSMAYGTPCVSSRFGTEGTGMENLRNIMIADRPDEFADAIIRLMNEEFLWKRISLGGIHFLKKNYAPERIELLMDALLSDATYHREKFDRIFYPLSNGYELAKFAKADGTNRDISSAENIWNAFLFAQIHEEAPVFLGMKHVPEGKKSAFASYRNIRCAERLLEESANFNAVVLPHLAALSPGDILLELETAFAHLKNGCRVFFSIPRKPFDHENFFRALKKMKYQRIFLLRSSAMPGEPEDAIALCAEKAIPKEGEPADGI